MTSLMLTMTDVFYSIGDFSQWVFKGMRVIGHGPNIVLWSIIVCLLVYWTLKMKKYKKEAQQNGTLE